MVVVLSCWGAGDTGQLGYESIENVGDGPGEMPPPKVNLGELWCASCSRQLAVGPEHTCVLISATDEMQCFGGSLYGQLGYGNQQPVGSHPLDMPPKNIDVGERILVMVPPPPPPPPPPPLSPEENLREWAVTSRTSEFAHKDRAYSTAVDSSGNIFITGAVEQEGAGLDVFVQKLTASGTVRWSVTWGGLGDDIGRGIALDGAGNAYVAGYFSGVNSTFGAYTLTNTVEGTWEGFAARVGNSGPDAGVVRWATRIGGNRSDLVYGIAVNEAAGSAVVGGAFESPRMELAAGMVLNNRADVLAVEVEPGVFVTNTTTETSDWFAASLGLEAGDVQWAHVRG
ncbi:hypothetical protein CYMTET_17896, partial [Cymbomonas tetramitiformis]